VLPCRRWTWTLYWPPAPTGAGGRVCPHHAPGSRHPKRYQDVEELLATGIDVYTTLNIQHLESSTMWWPRSPGLRCGKPCRTGCWTKPTRSNWLTCLLPNCSNASKRARFTYRAGRPGHPEVFSTRQPDALREMAMRRAAERVDEQMRTYMQTRAIPGPWPAATGYWSASAPARSANAWFVLPAAWPSRSTPNGLPFTWKRRPRPPSRSRPGPRCSHPAPGRRIGRQVYQLAGSYGHGGDHYLCRQHNITKIIAGKPLRPLWQELFRSSLVDQLIHHSGNIDVYVISSAAGSTQPIILSNFNPIAPGIATWKAWAGWRRQHYCVNYSAPLSRRPIWP